MVQGIDDETTRRRLEARLAELEAAEDSRREAAETVELDQARTGRLTRMDALQQQAMAQASNRRAQLEKQRIQGALRRLAEGTYGHCLRCEEPIDPRRLDADPATTLCIECATDDE
jgi:DnaK suppressor protein